MTPEELERIDRWHVLFDELCHNAGFHDSVSLAARYCELANGGRQQEYESVLRNLNNWRSGRHLPRLRSLRILERVLGMEREPALLARWNELYQRAGEEDDEPAVVSPAPPRASARIPAAGARLSLPLWQAAACGCLLLALGAAAGHVRGTGWRPWSGPADNAPLVVYKPQVYLKVGQSKTIHAERGNCGELPRDWPDVADDLPPSALGSFSDGGLARRNSKFCKGTTPARAIVYTAAKAGIEELMIQGDFLKVTVAEAE